MSSSILHAQNEYWEAKIFSVQPEFVQHEFTISFAIISLPWLLQTILISHTNYKNQTLGFAALISSPTNLTPKTTSSLFTMATPGLPLVSVQTMPAYPPREPLSGSAPALGPGRYRSGATEDKAGVTSSVEPLLTCTTEGEILSLFGPHSPCDDTDMYEEDCSPIEEGSPETPRACEINAPSLPSEVKTSTSQDLPLPHYAISGGQSTRGTRSSPSSVTNYNANTRSSLRSPCRCPFIAAYRIIEAAKRCAFAHLARGHAYRTCEGEQRPRLYRWMHELIVRNMDQAYEISALEIRRFSETVRPNGWPVHDGKIPVEQYSGHVQPWMRATAQRHACSAGNSALSEIHRRGGFTGTKRPSFHFKLLGRLDPNILSHPCQCKESHALSIASNVIQDTMSKLCPLISSSTINSAREDRGRSDSQLWKFMRAHIHSAMLDGLKEIAEVDDGSHLCSGQAMMHVQPWMTQAITRHCLMAAHEHSKKLRWKMRDLRINQLQDWLEVVYRQEAEDDAMIKNI